MYCVASDFDLETNGMGLDVRAGHPFSPIVLLCTDRSSFCICGPQDSRTYWATESRYPYLGGARRDMVEIDLGNNQRGMAQLVSFITMEQLPDDTQETCQKAILIRWMSPSSRSLSRDDYGRPLCGYPLSTNHCLWEWSDAGRIRSCFTRRGFANIIARQRMCGTTCLKIIGIELSTRRNGHVTMSFYMIQFFVMQTLQ